MGEEDTVSTTTAAVTAGASAKPSNPRAALTIATVGFFVVTLDAVVVNIALPTIGRQLGGDISTLQWVVDGYTLLFAALLLSSGAFSDRVGARRAFATGLVVFLTASMAGGLAPGVGALVAARIVQGAAAALMMPSGMALVSAAYPEPAARARAVAVWAMGAAVASSSGPVLGGVLTSFSWRLIFLLNVPVGLATLALLRRAVDPGPRPAPVDPIGQLSAVVAMGGLTYGAIEAGAQGPTAAPVLVSLGVAALAGATLVVSQGRVSHPVIPPALVRTRAVAISTVVGFAFMVAYFGAPFVMSLYLQQQRGMTPLATGLLFLPMMLVGAALTPFSARTAERTGSRRLVAAGLLVMTLGLLALGLTAGWASPVLVGALLVLVGLGGPLVMPPVTATLLHAAPEQWSGRASGLFNTSRQVGGALAVAVFGALLAGASMTTGAAVSLSLAAAVTLLAALAATRLPDRLNDRAATHRPLPVAGIYVAQDQRRAIHSLVRVSDR
jgi:DHA2 family methylenomycin A resistance protein-like MFS transporter